VYLIVEDWFQRLDSRVRSMHAPIIADGKSGRVFEFLASGGGNRSPVEFSVSAWGTARARLRFGHPQCPPIETTLVLGMRRGA